MGADPIFSSSRDIESESQFVNATETGPILASTRGSTGVRTPLVESTVNSVTLSESRLATQANRPHDPK